ncbi:hypothetical protein AVDCRST_MAG84-454, partial [uncultured Microcoleus sp.]
AKIGTDRTFGNYSLRQRILRAAATISCCCSTTSDEQPRI